MTTEHRARQADGVLEEICLQAHGSGPCLENICSLVWLATMDPVVVLDALSRSHVANRFKVAMGVYR